MITKLTKLTKHISPKIMAFAFNFAWGDNFKKDAFGFGIPECSHCSEQHQLFLQDLKHSQFEYAGTHQNIAWKVSRHPDDFGICGYIKNVAFLNRIESADIHPECGWDMIGFCSTDGANGYYLPSRHFKPCSGFHCQEPIYAGMSYMIEQMKSVIDRTIASGKN